MFPEPLNRLQPSADENPSQLRWSLAGTQVLVLLVSLPCLLYYVARSETWKLFFLFAIQTELWPRWLIPNAQMFFHFGELISILILFLLLILSLLGWGGLVLRVLWREMIWERWIIWAFAFGTGIFGTLMLCIGLTGHANTATAWSLLCAGLMAFCIVPKPAIHRPAKSLDRFEWTALILIALFVATFVIAAYPPEVEYDALEYHLGAIREYLQAGRIHFLPHNFYASMPALVEMLYYWAVLSTGTEILAKLIHSGFGIYCAFVIFHYARHWVDRRTGFAAVLVFYSFPFVLFLASTARIDLATTFYLTLASASLAELFVEKSDRLLHLSGISVGLAFATKYTVVPLAVIPLSVLIAIRLYHDHQNWMLVVRKLAVWFVLMALPVMPWMLKNWMFTGNPVYPIGNAIFKSPAWSDASNALFTEKHGATWGTEVFSQFFMDPIRYSFKEPGFAPVLLVGLIYLLFFRRIPQQIRWMLWISLACYLGWWAFTYRPPRFLFSIFGAVSLAVGYAYARLQLTRVIVVVFALIGLSINIIGYIGSDIAPPEGNSNATNSISSCVLGKISREDYLNQVGRGQFHPLMWINDNLPEDAKVLLIGEAKVYHLKRRFIWNTPFDRTLLLDWMREASSSGELLEIMRGQGITHIYINWPEVRRLNESYGYLDKMNWGRLFEFLKMHSNKVLEFGEDKNGNPRHEIFELQSPAEDG